MQEEQLQLFADASLDLNQLHLSESYARKTPFGERVVYGMLGFAACLGHLPVPQGKIPSGIRIDFPSALLLNVDYTLAIRLQTANEVKAALMDGSTAAMLLRLRFENGAPELVELPDSPIAPRSEPRMLHLADLRPGLSFRGSYAPAQRPFLVLLRALGVDRQQWGDALPLMALCISYLAGMELPGENAMLSGVRAELVQRVPEAPAEFEIKLVSYDDRFQMVDSEFTLHGSTGSYARGEIMTVARSPRAKNAIGAQVKGAIRFAGKNAVVIGASRGLGAALTLELVAGGCTVIGTYARSHADAEELSQVCHSLRGRLIMEQGDASDLDWCVALNNRVRQEIGRLDLLICNAAPSLQPLRLEQACYDRIQEFLRKGSALVVAPLSSFLQLVSDSNGCVLLISSVFVEHPPEIWPHYVALKAAAEGLVRTAAAANPTASFWIARPGSIRTDLTNTPLGWLDAEEPSTVAHRILEQIGNPVSSGEAHFCH